MANHPYIGASLPITITELLERQHQGKEYRINCTVHAHLDLLLRPDDCLNCAKDLKIRLTQAVAANQWLSQWKRDATQVINALEWKKKRIII